MYSIIDVFSKQFDITFKLYSNLINSCYEFNTSDFNLTLIVIIISIAIFETIFYTRRESINIWSSNKPRFSRNKFCFLNYPTLF